MHRIIQGLEDFFNILKKEFGFGVIYKKTKTLGDIILKKGGRLKRNTEEM